MFTTRVQIFKITFFKIACASINHTSFYKTRNLYLLSHSFIENFLSEKTGIDRKKHVSIMDTRKVTSEKYGLSILL